jgi:hypothetical protein
VGYRAVWEPHYGQGGPDMGPASFKDARQPQRSLGNTELLSLGLKVAEGKL